MVVLTPPPPLHSSRAARLYHGLPWAHASAPPPSAQVTDDHLDVSRRKHEKKVRRTSKLLGAEVAKKLGEMV